MTNSKKYSVLIIIIMTTTLVLFQNCGSRDYGIKIDYSSTDTDTSGGDTGGNTGGGGNPICDPFGNNGGNTNSNSGLKAKLGVMNSTNSSVRSSVANYFNPIYSTLFPDNIFFSQLNVTPRAWEDGFSGQDGQPLRINGQILNEWFGLEFKTQIQLDTSDEEGYYQFATLSDDGSILSINVDSNTQGIEQIIVNNDQTHSPKLGCAQSGVYFGRNQKLSSTIQYFQGPRNHIAMVLLWRKVSSNTPPNSNQLADQECGRVGTSYFFSDPANGSPQPLAPYTGLLQRGWKVLSPTNFVIPQNQVNPCL
jgi:hypothetical protein